MRLLDQINRENVELALLLSAIFFFTYWTCQLGLLDFIVLILSHVNSLYDIAIKSIIMLILIALYFYILYYIENVTELIYSSFKSKKIAIILSLIILSSIFVISIFSDHYHTYSVLSSIMLGIVIIGILSDSASKNPMTVAITSANRHYILSVFLAIITGIVYSDYIRKNYSASIISDPDSSLEYLGNISSTHVIKSKNKILFVSDVYLTKIEKPIKRPQS